MESNYLLFQRANNSTYQLVSENSIEKKELFLHFKGQIDNKSFEHTRKIGLQILENGINKKNPLVFRDSLGNRYKVTLMKQSKKHRLLKKLSTFIKFFQNESRLNIKIEKIASSPFHSSPSLILSERELKLDAPPFFDAYTQLASEAFQKFEPEFAAHDIEDNRTYTDHSTLKIVEHNGKLQLVKKETQTANDKTTFANYLRHMENEYGKEKIRYICHLYKISTDGPLTPEIVYRINIGVGNIEIQDLNAFIANIKNFANKNPNNDAFTHYITNQQLRGIQRHPLYDANHVTPIENWFEKFCQLSPDNQLKEAVKIFTPTAEEKERQYTGRKIVYPIMSKYTIADKKFYKAWVDQQELLQVFSDLENFGGSKGINWDGYLELLSHVVVKKHLARRHPEEEYRIGALIPAPRDANENPQWYVVSSCISNGKGLHSYVLTPLNSTSSLPAIKLYRSTAHSHYALDNFATVANDINPFNSPGYEGFERSRSYEKDFFEERTIPVWVGYLLQAEQKNTAPVSLTEADNSIMIQSTKLLGKAMHAYEKELLKPYEKKNLAQIFKLRDADIIEIAQSLYSSKLKNFSTIMKILPIIYRYRKSTINESQGKEDAEFLLSLIDEKNTKYVPLAQELRRYLDKPSIENETITQLQAKIEELKNNLQAAKNPDDLNKILIQLRQIAADAHELPEQKKKQSIIFTGHSMGGAVGQKAFVEYTAKAQRIPLPDYSMQLCTFDAPAIGQNDNRLYHNFGEHAELFKDLNSTFSITHRFEAGDFVSQGGEEHLGAAETDAEKKDLIQWSNFNASVSESKKHATTAVIRDTHVVHATQFEKGKRESPEMIRRYTDYQNYLQTSSLPDAEKQIQEIEKVKYRLLGDYERTWIDATTLKKYDKGEKTSWSSIQTVFKQTSFRSNIVEKIRSYLGLIIRIVFFSLTFNKAAEKHEGGHGDWWRNRDDNGVFALNLDGIQSRTTQQSNEI